MSQAPQGAGKKTPKGKGIQKQIREAPEFLRKHFIRTSGEARENRASRALATAFIFSVAMNFGQMATINQMMPLKTTEPWVLTYGDDLDKTIFLRPLDLTENHLFLVQAQIAAVIKDRYDVVRDRSFMISKLLGDRDKNLWRSHVTEEVFKEQVPVIKDMLEYMRTVTLFRREVKINRITANKNQPGTFYVIYTTWDSRYGRSPELPNPPDLLERRWRVDLGIQRLRRDDFSPLNPLGIQIYTFSTSELTQ